MSNEFDAFRTDFDENVADNAIREILKKIIITGRFQIVVFAFVRESHSFETILFREKNIGKFSLLRLRPDSIVGAQESRGRRKSQMQKMTRNLMGMGGAAALLGARGKGRLPSTRELTWG